MKSLKLILVSLAFAAGLFVPEVARAEETYVCGQSYGQPVVCGVKAPEEEAVVIKAGLAEDLRLIGLAFLAGSTILFFKAKKTNEPSLIHYLE